MKIIFFSIISGKNDGVFKKVLAQFSSMKEHVEDIQLVLLTDFELDRAAKDTINQLAGGVKIVKTTTKRNTIANRFEKMRCLNELFIDSKQDTVIYLRYLLSDPLFYFFIRSERKAIVITEHQSLEPHELLIQKKYKKYLLETFFGKYSLKHVNAIAGVTEEICRFELSRKGEAPCFVASNGIEVSSTILRKIPPWEQGGKLHLLCVAQVANWHGLDRLIWGMANSGNSNVYLHIVGDGPAIPQLKELVSHKDLEDQVIFHGFKTGEELDEMFDKCHIAVGSLGIHRKGLKETSDLKSREYCARGIPFFNSALDADFPVSFPFRLKIPEDDSPIDMEQVMYFAKNVLADTEHPIFMQEYALSNLDWNIKMRKLKGFFEEVLKKQVGK